jgi:hypothetical protein
MCRSALPITLSMDSQSLSPEGRWQAVALINSSNSREVDSMQTLTLVLGLIVLLLTSGCDQESIANRGFSLPQGNVENGKLLMDQFGCWECHTLAGTDFLGEEWRLKEGDGIAVELGGEKTRVQTYGDLVSSIINPSHRIAKGYDPEEVTYEDGESKMYYYNSYMTVAELVDIVTYLQTQYKVKVEEETYPYVYH